MAQTNGTRPCTFPGCVNQRHGAKYCQAHEGQLRRNGRLQAIRPHNYVANGQKKCGLCGEAKPVSDYYPQNGRPAYRCKRCYFITRQMKRYGVDREFAERIADGAHCDVCGDFATGKQLHIDHCHDSGDVRGVLCHGCNTSIGLVGERPDVLRALADYLER